ncbi:MAG: hypothetical protein EA377_08195, partial [Phycisphaerales bacterium]
VLWGPQNTIGDPGHGTFLTTKGAKFNAQLHLQMGMSPESSASAIIRDPGSHWQIGETLYVGWIGTADVQIKQGGRVDAMRTLIGNAPQSTGELNVRDPGSTLKCVFRISLGEAGGTGYFNVKNQGSAESLSGLIAEGTGSFGHATVSDHGSSWHVGNSLFIGFRGNGWLNITNGGHVTSEFGLIGWLPNSIGTVSVDGSESAWNIDDFLWIGRAGVQAATLELLDDAVVTAPVVTIFPMGTLAGQGTLDGNVVSQGRIHLGPLAGSANTSTLTITGNANLLENTLAVRLDPQSPKSDRLIVGGNATLGGTLELWSLQTGTFTKGDTLQIISAESITGTFDEIDLPASFPDGAVSLIYEQQSVYVVFGTDVADDHATNSVLNLLSLLGEWGPCSGFCRWDLNGDGQVGITDLFMLLANW